MLEVDPSERFSASECLEHPLMQSKQPKEEEEEEFINNDIKIINLNLNNGKINIPFMIQESPKHRNINRL